ncbi:hypothetical protein [Embleya sp. NBC_00896]|uniref:hypothetical protein n=1 Tax=Embleya sp. NBC_00896 TaxID=2975961 RepID=UPI003867BE83
MPRDHGCALHDKGARGLPTSKVDLYAAIRRDSRAGLSSRALERKYGVGFAPVQNALPSAWPEPRKKLPPRVTRLDLFKPLIDRMLRADLDAPRKQRHTVKRIFDRLVDEHGADEISTWRRRSSRRCSPASTPLRAPARALVHSVSRTSSRPGSPNRT